MYVVEDLERFPCVTKTDFSYYAVALDVISLLTNLASASRLPIYLSCQSELRKEVYELMRNSCSKHVTTKKTNLRRQIPFISQNFLFSNILEDTGLKVAFLSSEQQLLMFDKKSRTLVLSLRIISEQHNGLKEQRVTRGSDAGKEKETGDKESTLRNGRHVAVYADGDGGTLGASEFRSECDAAAFREHKKDENSAVNKSGADDVDDSDGTEEEDDDPASAIEMLGEVTLL
ncbi:unnamed protein product [Gongylonema pulchrum]|uniref:Elongator complex protein 5 n=1 Tax=Gongylonema pulchrum TaxID=637853 RepID=A0A183DAH4_9BILA|nr:unnamed protein product [Gongylonema pulchrum]